jgi:ribosome-associated translation inhibitor RaiA
VEFKVHVHGNILVVKDSSDDFTKSMNEASDKMIRQLKKSREKLANK